MAATPPSSHSEASTLRTATGGGEGGGGGGGAGMGDGGGGGGCGGGCCGLQIRRGRADAGGRSSKETLRF